MIESLLNIFVLQLGDRYTYYRLPRHCELEIRRQIELIRDKGGRVSLKTVIVVAKSVVKKLRLESRLLGMNMWVFGFFSHY